MLEIKEQETLPFEEDTQHQEDVTRYRKRIDVLLEGAEIEAEMEGDDTLKELTGKGFNASYYKTSKKSFSLKVGQFSNLKDAQKAQDRLSLKGFLSASHKADVPVKTYMVQLGVFPNREKTRLTQEKLARAGFPKTFIR